MGPTVHEKDKFNRGLDAAATAYARVKLGFQDFVAILYKRWQGGVEKKKACLWRRPADYVGCRVKRANPTGKRVKFIRSEL